MIDVRNHEPTAAALARARRAGEDLLALRASDPLRYAMFNAERLASVPPDWREALGEVVFAAFPDRFLFDVPSGRDVTLLAFPPLAAGEVARLDERLARFVATEPFASSQAYFRVVADARGERREVGRPVAPADWLGAAGVMVGPFRDEREADAWGAERVVGRPGLVYDAVPHAEAWFVDVFEGER